MFFRDKYLQPEILKRWAPIPLRLLVGYGFIAHGFAKVARGPQHFAEILHALSVPAPELAAWATIGVELFGGFAVLAGVLVPLASVPMAVVLIVAMFTVHLPYGFSSIKLQDVTSAGPHFGSPGYELDLIYLACLAALVLGGSGPVSLDIQLAALKRKVRRKNAATPAHIRPAVVADADGIARIFLESAEYHADLDPERYSAPDVKKISERYREEWLPSAHAVRSETTFVAELNGEIVGFIDARLEQSPDAMHRDMVYCHIAEIGVGFRHRNHGIGRRMLRTAEEWGKARGAEFASLEFHAANKRANSFYRECMGYRAASIAAIKRLTQESR